MGTACALMYFYYSTVYSTIQDVIEPGLRGTAMAIYFLAMYLLGASLGPYVIGLVSDYFTRQAAQNRGRDRFYASGFRTVSRRRTAFGDVYHSGFERFIDVRHVRRFAHGHERNRKDAKLDARIVYSQIKRVLRHILRHHK